MTRPAPINLSSTNAPRRRERLFARTGTVKPFELKAAAGAVTIMLFDEVGPWGVTAGQFAGMLRDAAGRPVTLQINSPGGDIFDGIAMLNSLIAYSGSVRAEIMGLAASAASIVAMGADVVAIGQGAFTMIHRSWGLTVGNTNDHVETADVLARIDDSMAATYAMKTGRTAKEMLSLMNEESWFNAEAAIEAGLADELLPASSGDAAALARFDLSAYRCAPPGLSQPKERAEVSSRAAIERMLLQGGMRGGAAKLCSKVAFEALTGAPSREFQSLVDQIASATAELQKRKMK